MPATWGKGIYYGGQKIIFGLNQVLVGAPDVSKGRSADFCAADLMGPFSEPPDPYFFVLVRRLDPT